MTDLQTLSDVLRRRANLLLEAFDEAWKLHGLPKALEVCGDGVIRAQVAYQAAVDLEAIRRGDLSLAPFLRALEEATRVEAVPGNPMSAACQRIAREEAKAILDHLGARNEAVIH